MNKRGQFYLVMAFILIVILIGFFSLKQTFNNSSIKIYDLKEELDIESASVIDFKIFQKDTSSIEDFINLYSTYAKDNNAELYFIYGDQTNIYKYEYTKKILGEIKMTDSGLIIELPELEKIKKKIEKEESEIQIKFGEINYQFSLKPGENFYYVIQTQTNGETYSLTN
jgi:uncharacterized protein (UPF0333 family)